MTNEEIYNAIHKIATYWNQYSDKYGQELFRVTLPDGKTTRIQCPIQGGNEIESNYSAQGVQVEAMGF